MTVQLETRMCTNKGCKRTFRVLTTSTQVVCSNSCSSGPFGAFPQKGAAKKPSGPKTPDIEAAEPAEAGDWAGGSEAEA